MEKRMPRQPFLTDLLIYPTSRCNLRCRHCYFAPAFDEKPGRRSDEISYEQICRAVDDLLPFGLRTCKLSGGEPFLRDDLMDVCRYLDSKDVGIVIETNGTLVTKQHADTLARLRKRPFLSVSVDGAKAETHEALRGIDGCFDKALEGLDYLVRAGLNVQVIAAGYEGNKNELPRTMDMATARGAKSFKVCFIHATGRAKSLPRIAFDESLGIDQQLAEHARSTGIRYCSSVPVALKSVTHIMDSCALSGRCSIASTVALLSDGTITICGMGRYASDFRFGRLGEDDLATVWMTHPTLDLIRKGIPSRLGGICGRCILRSACLGYCRLENESVTLDDLFAPFTRCAEMDERGLFPKGRTVERSNLEAESIA